MRYTNGSKKCDIVCRIKQILKNKVFIILSLSIISVIIVGLIGYLISFSSLKINGKNRVYISYNEEYKDQGASFKLFNLDLSKGIKTKNNVKTGVVGSYKVTYKVKYLFFNVKKARTVNIVDNVAPKITLNGENKINICPGKEYEEEGYEAIDEYDGNLTSKVFVERSDNEIAYQVSDSSKNKEKVFRELIRVDEEAPKLVLKGSQTTYIRNGSKYNEYGYNVSDNCDENIEVLINGSVDTSKDGTYTLSYTAKDISGNETKLERKVVVYTDNRIGIIYLTFDDGPSGAGTTEQILNVLRDEGVKATFFVTGSGPDSLIRREYDEGHTVALHTNTHNYSYVYSSVDNYYADLNAVRTRVYNITGEYSNVIRFPGGSNNTVSNRYSPGIMDTLTKDVMDKGYIYFDWNISSGDAGSCSTPSCVYSNVIRGLSKDRINIVLMHDIKWYTANAIKDIIMYGKENGYVFDVINESTYQVKFK